MCAKHCFHGIDGLNVEFVCITHSDKKLINTCSKTRAKPAAQDAYLKSKANLYFKLQLIQLATQ